MKKLLLLLLFIPLMSIGQEKNIQLTSKNPNFPPQYVVVEKDSMSVEEGYKRAIEWIRITYANPSKVILSEIENKYIRIEGFADGLYQADRLNANSAYDVTYTIEFKFKENRIKFEVLKATYRITSGYYNGVYLPASEQYLNFVYEDLFKKNGKPKFELRKARQVTNYFNGLVNSFRNYVYNPISNEVNVNGDDDW